MILRWSSPAKGKIWTNSTPPSLAALASAGELKVRTHQVSSSPEWIQDYKQKSLIGFFASV